MFKVNNKNTKMTSLTHSVFLSSASNVDFEQENISWKLSSDFLLSTYLNVQHPVNTDDMLLHLYNYTNIVIEGFHLRVDY